MSIVLKLMSTVFIVQVMAVGMYLAMTRQARVNASKPGTRERFLWHAEVYRKLTVALVWPMTALLILHVWTW